MIDYWKGDKELMANITRKKLSWIESEVPPEWIYAETSHLFIKGFGWELSKLVDDRAIGVVILKREKKEIIQSLYRLGTTPFTNQGVQWILGLQVRSPIVPFPHVFVSKTVTFYTCFILKLNLRILDKLSRSLFQVRFFGPRCFRSYEEKWLSWYIEETVALGNKFREEHPNIRFYETTVEELNTNQGVNRLLNFFGLEPKPELSKFIGIPVNQKP